VSEVVATVVVPTTGDRGPLLRYSVDSVLSQTVQDLEVFVVGDGMDASTRAAAKELCMRDGRVRLFDFPKHESRGEPHRHELLSGEARGRIVGYLCDRDLWLPTHLEELDRMLRAADFAYTLRYRVGLADEIVFTRRYDLRDPDELRASLVDLPWMLVPLSFAGHTLEAYRRLPYGWRTAPKGEPTDAYMWRQFLLQPWLRVDASPVPTVLAFKRGGHPGWSTERRLEILERWSARLDEPDGVAAVKRQVIDTLWREWARLDAADRARLLVRSRRLGRRVLRRLRLR
jgi:glycosyltransferase involved in cell wall biosynthesis